jgi:hypothetical protein
MEEDITKNTITSEDTTKNITSEDIMEKDT